MPIACAPAEHADTVPNDCPRRPYFIETTPLAALAIRIGMPSGETFSGPRSCMIVCCSSIVVIPPIPVPITHAERSGSPGSSSSEAGVRQSLARGGQRQLGEAVRAAHLLDGEVLLGLELVAAPEPVLDAGAPGAPALVKRPRPHAERRDRADAGDHDAAPHESLDITRSTA